MWQILSNLAQSIAKIAASSSAYSGASKSLGEARSAAAESGARMTQATMDAARRSASGLGQHGQGQISPAEMRGSYDESKVKSIRLTEQHTGAEEELTKKEKEAAEQLDNFKKALFRSGVGVTATIAGLRYVSKVDEANARSMWQFNAALSQSIGNLDKERMLRLSQMAQTTGPSSKAEIEAQNAQEQATQKLRSDWQIFLNKLGWLGNKLFEGTGNAYGKLTSGTLNTQDEVDTIDIGRRAAELMNQGMPNEKAWKQAEEEIKKAKEPQPNATDLMSKYLDEMASQLEATVARDRPNGMPDLPAGADRTARMFGVLPGPGVPNPKSDPFGALATHAPSAATSPNHPFWDDMMKTPGSTVKQSDRTAAGSQRRPSQDPLPDFPRGAALWAERS